MKKDLNYFLRENKPEIVEIEAPPTIKDENGKPVMMQVRVLTQEEIDKIFDMYTSKRPEKVKKRNPLVVNGEVAMRKDRDASRAVRHLVAEALVHPDLHSEDVQNFFKCYELSELIYKMFPAPSEYQYVVNSVLEVLGLTDDTDDDDVENAKN